SLFVGKYLITEEPVQCLFPGEHRCVLYWLEHRHEAAPQCLLRPVEDFKYLQENPVDDRSPSLIQNSEVDDHFAIGDMWWEFRGEIPRVQPDRFDRNRIATMPPVW